MGCGDPKEKIENEMLKMKMERIALQTERYKQLELLNKLDGCTRKQPKIPDYIDPTFLKNNPLKQSDNPSPININNNNTKFQRRANRSKTHNYNKKEKIFNFDEEDKENKEGKEVKENKENKENKEDKEDKEDKEVKEDKEDKENNFIRKGKKRNTHKRKTMRY